VEAQVTVYLNVIQIIVSIALVGLLILQSKGGGLNRMFGADASVYRSRRGVEKTIFNFTIGLIVLFVIISVMSVLFSR
jgi:preprotein translocase subunit SecG